MSSLFDRKKILPRFKIFAYIMLILGIVVIVKASTIVAFQTDYWNTVASQLQRDSVPVEAMRGNILSDDGRLMAGSLPEYMLVMDCKTMLSNKGDTMLSKPDTLRLLCEGLHEIFPERSAEAFKEVIENGIKDSLRYCKIWDTRVPHNIYTEVCQLPFFRLGPNRSGFHGDKYEVRQHPHGSLARRTIGILDPDSNRARCGLELSFNTELSGVSGCVRRQKVMNKYLGLSQQDPINGSDIVTTIDLSIQDIAERALRSELEEINGERGVVIVMDVESGDVKAIVNLGQNKDGSYSERENYAVSDRCEPGSVFKTASMLVALENGIDTSAIVHTGNGVREMHHQKMRDHNWSRGGYGTINMSKAIQQSSNIGVSVLIDDKFKNNPSAFVQGLYDLGLNDDLQIPIAGYKKAVIRMPDKDHWYGTTLPWMSIGYETLIPPITTATFYNSIANGGKMMRPRFVKQIVKDGEVIQEFPPEVMRERIARPENIEKMTRMLELVVKKGTGKAADPKTFTAAGKTGTAQIASGTDGYKTGRMHYLISFCGFFPVEKPQYTVLVWIKKYGQASGGQMCGKVFKEVALGIMAQSLRRDAVEAKGDGEDITPEVKNGNVGAAGYVLDELGINTDSNFQNNFKQSGKAVWGEASVKAKGVLLQQQAHRSNTDSVPDVYGMGARDAVFLLENCGLKVQIQGRGKVRSQSIAAGTTIQKGAVCHIVLG